MKEFVALVPLYLALSAMRDGLVLEKEAEDAPMRPLLSCRKFVKRECRTCL